MKIAGIIPARYASTRLPGKPLKDILGRPMIWWVYKRVREVEQLDEQSRKEFLNSAKGKKCIETLTEAIENETKF